MRLINADKLIQRIVKGETSMNRNPAIYTSMITEDLYVDAEPVRHGKWVDSEAFKRPWFRHHIFECSVCRNTLDMDGVNAGRGDANYCPNCGAKMDGES